ncbi:hypothetical protein KC571_01305, partial [candidate division WWE3 bacterium]|nr:hypothetical protein [candidate division WWE3 bacterium]
NLEKIEDFISGWQKEGIVYGKPVGIALASNGTIYVSDDQAGAIYKFSPSTNQTLTKNCMVTGCSGQICSDQEVMTTCEYRETYGCYDQASCEYNEITDQCEWTMTPELSQCLQNTNTE